MTPPIVNRRRFLAALGAASMSPIAGCNGGDDTGGSTPASPTPSPSPTPTPTTPNAQALDHYDTGVDILVRTKETLDEWAADSYEDDRVGELQATVGTARDELEQADEQADPSGDLIDQIDQARLVADFQELSLAYYDGVNVFFQVIAEAKSFGEEELHQRAADSFVDARDVLDDIRTVLDDMGSALDAIDNETLDEPELVYTGEPLDHLDLADRTAIDGGERYAVGYENVHRSFVQLETGQTHYENEEFTEAREAWETGQERARDAKSAFEAAIDNDHLPQNLTQESIRLLSTSETIIEAFEKFVEGGTEAEAGNTDEANDLILEGFDILGQL